MSWREDRLHAWLSKRPRPSSLVGSAGHDAAVLRPVRGRPVVCADQTIEGVHFEPGTSARLVARKAVGRTLSDLAATAARPKQVVLTVAAPRTTAERWLRELLAAVASCAAGHGAELVAGDLAGTAGPVSLSVTALGVLPGRRRPPGRDRARPGQLLILTGPVGGSRLGRHLRVEPRLDEGRWLHERGATAMMDVSDGLALDLSRLARSSDVRIELDELPVHPDARRAARGDDRSAWEHALTDGEDHELVATLAPKDWSRVRGAARRRFPALRAIGRVTEGSGLIVPDEAGAPTTWRGRGGWLHG